MKLKLAKQTLNSKAKELELSEVVDMLEKDKVVFLDCTNTQEELNALLNELQDYKVHLNTVKYGLLDDEFIYEVHIL